MRLIQSVFVLLFLCICTIASAQDINNIDFQSINVDNLSEQQIQQIRQEAEARGLSNDQVVQLAVARGMPQSEATKLRRRLQQTSTGITQETVPTSGSERRRMLRDSTAAQPSASDTTRDDTTLTREQRLKNKIFGFSLFRNRNVEFIPAVNIPTPKNYQLGSGDEIFIDIWGAAQTTYQLQVTPDGNLLIDNIGPVSVDGLTIEEASQKLHSRLGEIYSGLNPANENQKDTYMQVSLGQIRSIKVTVLGEVQTPGTYTLPSLATVFNALYQAGGPTTTGSFRNINIIRGDSVAATFDLYDILIYGDQSSNIILKEQDIIQIQPYANRVEVEGEIKRPGIYETRDGETLSDLINYVGGFTDKAYTGRIKVIGNTPTEKKINDVSKPHFDDYEMENGDLVTVGKILDRFSNLIEIEGAVFRPGEYELNDTTTVYSLIQRANGLKGDAFMNRGLIYRTREDFTIEAIPFSVRELMRNPEENNIELIKDDVVQISSIFDLRENYTISINGPVQDPDTYSFVYGMTLEDLIFKAGGFNQSADPYRIEVARRIRNVDTTSTGSKIANIYTFRVNENLRLNPEDANFVLQPFDQVYIRKLPNYEPQQEISVVGQVKYPGKYSLSTKNDRISDLIERAGGLSSEAYTEGATLFRKRQFTEQQSQQNLANIEGLTQQEQQQQLQQRGGERASAQIGIDLQRVLQNPGSRFDLYLEEGDSLFVPKQLQTVSVKGGVFYPTTIRHQDNSSFKDYITAAGGFTDLAKKNRAYVIYPNGDVDRVKRFLFFKNYPDVEPGATIVIPEKQELRRLSPQERVALYSSITSTAVLIVSTIIQIQNSRN